MRNTTKDLESWCFNDFKVAHLLNLRHKLCTVNSKYGVLEMKNLDGHKIVEEEEPVIEITHL